MMGKRPFAAHAADLLRGGYSPVPLRPGEKRPLFEKWDHLRRSVLIPRELAELSRSAAPIGLGVAGGYGGLVPIDIDTDDEDIRRAVWRALPRPTVGKRGKRGCTAFFWSPETIPAIKVKQPLGDRRYQMLVEVLTTGQTVLPPTVHPDTAEPYKWLTQRTLFDTSVHELPLIFATDIERMRAALEPWAPLPKSEPIQFSAKELDAAKIHSRRTAALANGLLAKIAMTLARARPNSGRNNELFRASCTLGKWVHHGVLPKSQVAGALFDACRMNGLWTDKDCGPKGCLATFESGLRKSVGDKLSLPDDSDMWKRKQYVARSNR